MSWDDNDLEFLNHCPACGADDSHLKFEGLTDVTFLSGEDKWNFHQCKNCASGFLNPRPNILNIGRIYDNYYTHNNEEKKSIYQLVRKRIANGYVKKRFGYEGEDFFWWGSFIAKMMPKNRSKIDAAYRHLPNKAGTVLDIGCGNGDFLTRAKSAGWKVLGIDPDSKAIEVAKSKGLNVRVGSIDSLEEHETFDVITASHVIEHVHDPKEFLIKCRLHLNEGGYLWIDTPNLNSQGFLKYKENWRGLEIPRHFVIFNNKSLKSLLIESGFKKIEDMPYRPLCEYIFHTSEAIKSGYSMLDISEFKMEKKM